MFFFIFTIHVKSSSEINGSVTRNRRQKVIGITIKTIINLLLEKSRLNPNLKYRGSKNAIANI
jgi:hypothetical protein